MEGALRIRQGGTGWEFDLPRPSALAALLQGKPAHQAATLLPRLFNLCAAAQGLAARLSLGLPIAPDACAGLAREVLRDHLLALFVTLPRLAGLGAQALPEGWQRGADIAPLLWGGARPVMLAQWLAAGQGLAPLAAHIHDGFGTDQGRVRPLPLVSADRVDGPEALENSPAARHADHALMRQAEALAGRGALWRLIGRMLDAEAAASGALPAPQLREDGMALVPAARGVYALRLTATAGRVTGLTRITPTDHMLAPDGALRQAFATLRQPALAPLLLALHDPCLPVTFEQVQHA